MAKEVMAFEHYFARFETMKNAVDEYTSTDEGDGTDDLKLQIRIAAQQVQHRIYKFGNLTDTVAQIKEKTQLRLDQLEEEWNRRREEQQKKADAHD
jgi:hypothetical protein